MIQNEILLLYSNLYKSNYNKADCVSLYGTIGDQIHKLNEEDKVLIDDELTLEEMDIALKHTSNCKSQSIY